MVAHPRAISSMRATHASSGHLSIVSSLESPCPNQTTIKLESRENWPKRRASRRNRSDDPRIQLLPAQPRRRHQRSPLSPEIRRPLGAALETCTVECSRRPPRTYRSVASRQDRCAGATLSISFSPTASPRYVLRRHRDQCPDTSISRVVPGGTGVFHFSMPLRRLRRAV